MEAEYICLSCERPLQEWELWECHNSYCDEKICPGCGGEVQAIQEYNEAMKINAREEK